MDGDAEERCIELLNQHYDGRWMLVAQHLGVGGSYGLLSISIFYLQYLF